jgi:hypothetical protein
MTPLVRTTLLTFLAVLAAYEGFLRLAAPQVDQGADMGLTNAIRLENYADGGAPDTVLVGSSLAGRLQARMLPANWSNIALTGGSALTGLQLVAQSAITPRRVIIESNYLDRPSDAATLDALTDWPQPLLRHLFWFTRTAYMPLNLVFSEVEEAIQRRRAEKGTNVESAPANQADLTAALRPAYQSPPDFSRLPELAALVGRLQARGIEIGFVELPVEESLANTPHLVLMRQQLRAMFGSVCWLRLGGGPWHTGDGEHLLTQDAARAARELAAAPCER